jgi:hypothetical protein
MMKDSFWTIQYFTLDIPSDLIYLQYYSFLQNLITKFLQDLQPIHSAIFVIAVTPIIISYLVWVVCES